MAAGALQPLPLPVPAAALAPPIHSRHVAVIGAGASGLVAAHELRRAGHKVAVFERQDRVGGTWVYNPETESDPMGIDPARPIVHSSLYASLRTNLPRESMGFRDFPFVAVDSGQKDLRRFPGHAEVLQYLRDFAEKFGISEMIRFETEVLAVGLVEDGKWKLGLRRGKGRDCKDEIFDAVVVCSGHYTEPRIAEIPGVETWPGKQCIVTTTALLSHFEVVIVIGSSASAVDISSEIAGVAKEVHIAARSNGMSEAQSCYENLWFHPMIESAHEDGTVLFLDGTVIHPDFILHCTGYKYHFPFLNSDDTVTVDDSRVGPLYKHVFPPALAPWLSFVGITWKIIPFPLFELQSKWIARVLSGQISLPSEQDMMRDVESYYSNLEASGIPKRYAHNISGHQFEYSNWLAAECNCAASEEWRKQMYVAVSKNRRARPETYRDEWEDDDLVVEAHKDFAKYSSGNCNGCIS